MQEHDRGPSFVDWEPQDLENGGFHIPPFSLNGSRKMFSSKKSKHRNKRRSYTFSEKSHKRMLLDLPYILGCQDYEIPVLFSKPMPKPLKIGIFHDLLLRYPHANASKLGKFLASYTRSKPYQIALKKFDRRIDLDGNEVGEVSNDQKCRADRVMNIVHRSINERRIKRRRACL